MSTFPFFSIYQRWIIENHFLAVSQCLTFECHTLLWSCQWISNLKQRLCPNWGKNPHTVLSLFGILKIWFKVLSVYPLIFCSRAIWHSPHRGRQAMTTQSSHTEPWEEAQAQKTSDHCCMQVKWLFLGICSISFADTESLYLKFFTKAKPALSLFLGSNLKTTVAHLHQCGICHACWSSEQSWHREGMAHSSCPHCPEPPYRPGCMGWTWHKDL